MGRPPINVNYAARFGTFHSMTVKPVNGGFQALARLCYLTDEGDWKWVNRRLLASTADEARNGLHARVTEVLGCRSMEETNRLTRDLHRGHRHIDSETRAELTQ